MTWGLNFKWEQMQKEYFGKTEENFVPLDFLQIMVFLVLFRKLEYRGVGKEGRGEIFGTLFLNPCI